MILAAASIGAHANDCGTSSMFQRGTNNAWGKNAMVCDINGLWHTTVNLTSPGSFKFDVTGDWSESYGDNNLTDKTADRSGANIPVNHASYAGVYFDYRTKTYSVSHCEGSPLFLDAGGFPPSPHAMNCDSTGNWSADLLFAPSRFVNTDTSSPWPNGLSSVTVITDTFVPSITVTPPVSGRYRLAAGINSTTQTVSAMFFPQDCGGMGLNLSFVSFTGKEQNLPMTCNLEDKKYTVDYDPAMSGNPFFRFIDGTDVAYGDNNNDGILDVSGNGISVPDRSRITVYLRSKMYRIVSLSQPCGTASLSLLAPSMTGHEQANPMTCEADGKWHFTLNTQTAVPFRLQDAQGMFWGDNEPNGTLDNSGNLILAENNTEVIVDYIAKTYQLKNVSNWKRTIVFIFGQTTTGQDMFVRGGIDHSFAQANLGLTCTAENKLCAIPIKHRNLKNATTAPWKANDTFLDWYGSEPNQSTAAQGSPLDWTTNVWPAEWGTKRTVEIDGFGETPLNLWGQHYWMLDVDMDCSKTVNGWFELKSFISNGPSWEGNIAQVGAPYVSNNHFAQCGKLNKFERGSNAVLIKDI